MACTSPPTAKRQVCAVPLLGGCGGHRCAGSALRGQVGLLPENAAGPVGRALQDPKLHPFGELERRMHVVGHDEGVDLVFGQPGPAELSVLAVRVGR